jgi:hypothetical protein
LRPSVYVHRHWVRQGMVDIHDPTAERITALCDYTKVIPLATHRPG